MLGVESRQLVGFDPQALRHLAETRPALELEGCARRSGQAREARFQRGAAGLRPALDGPCLDAQLLVAVACPRELVFLRGSLRDAIGGLAHRIDHRVGFPDGRKEGGARLARLRAFGEPVARRAELLQLVLARHRGSPL